MKLKDLKSMLRDLVAEPIAYFLYLRAYSNESTDFRVGKCYFIGSERFIAHASRSMQRLLVVDNALYADIISFRLVFIEENKRFTDFPWNPSRGRFLIKSGMSKHDDCEGVLTAILVCFFHYLSMGEKGLFARNLFVFNRQDYWGLEKARNWFQEHGVDRRAVDEINRLLREDGRS